MLTADFCVPGRYNCRQEWPYPSSSVVYLSFLTFCLLLIPLIVMTVLYSLVISTLWKGIQLDIQGTMTIDGKRHILISVPDTFVSMREHFFLLKLICPRMSFEKKRQINLFFLMTIMKTFTVPCFFLFRR